MPPKRIAWGPLRKLCLWQSCCRPHVKLPAKIAEKSPAMVKLAKEALTGIEDGNLEDKYRWEQGFTLEAYTMGDSQESRDAFVQKRDATFKD